MPALSERGRKSARENERGRAFTTIVAVLATAATYATPPPPPPRNHLRATVSRPFCPSRGAGRPANGIMLNPPRGKFATRRRDVYLRAVSSSREIRAYKLAAFSRRQFDQDRESRSRADDSCQLRKICAPASGEGRKSAVSYENVHAQIRCGRYGRRSRFREIPRWLG